MNEQHKEVKVYYNGQFIMVDENMIPLLQKLWDLGLKTDYCCQGYSDTSGYIKFNSIEDRKTFVSLLKDGDIKTSIITQHDYYDKRYLSCVYWSPSFKPEDIVEALVVRT